MVDFWMPNNPIFIKYKVLVKKCTTVSIKMAQTNEELANNKN